MAAPTSRRLRRHSNPGEILLTLLQKGSVCGRGAGRTVAPVSYASSDALDRTPTFPPQPHPRPRAAGSTHRFGRSLSLRLCHLLLHHSFFFFSPSTFSPCCRTAATNAERRCSFWWQTTGSKQQPATKATATSAATRTDTSAGDPAAAGVQDVG